MEPDTTPAAVLPAVVSGPPNIVVETPVDKHRVELKPFITGYDKEAMESLFYESASVSASAGDTAPSIGFDMPAIAKANRKAIEQVVRSVDGNSDNVVDSVLSMRSVDYEFVVVEINKITNPVDEEKKSD